MTEKLVRIRGTDDKKFSQYYEFLKKNYGASLVDPVDVIQRELGDTNKGNYITPHAIVVAKDKGRIVAAASGNLLPVWRRSYQKDIGVIFLSYLPPEKRGHEQQVGRAVGELERILAGYASWRGMVAPVSILEAESDKVGFYEALGFKTLEGVAYHQPPLDWDNDGRALGEPEKLLLMAKPIKGKAHEADVATKEGTALRRELVSEIGDYLNMEWYVPHPEYRNAKANERIWTTNERLRNKLQKSLGNREWISLK